MHGYQLQEIVNRDLEYCTNLKQATVIQFAETTG